LRRRLRSVTPLVPDLHHPVTLPVQDPRRPVHFLREWAAVAAG